MHKKFILPKPSPALAEFTGIMLGDGGISRNQIFIATHSLVDAEYAEYISALITKLFGAKVSYSQYRNAHCLKLVVSGMELVNYCHHTLGLPIGNKLRQGLDIPKWIKGEREYEKKCVRGLFDTDGCLFWENHFYKTVNYSYPRMNLTVYSRDLINSVHKILSDVGFNARIRRKGKSVQLESRGEINRYFEYIGSSNPKHLKRYAKKAIINQVRRGA